ncbi:2-succinyl-5-enolpyruvyl-6-hydroxy-3-cyclohexene-1-carboxylic-acid synthase [Luteococcus peritonei]|uniref:2-succinyl-5-enolpyruvyl-6-hydroxy-3-cyclohexene-1-carboxylate synthase n=1 Tax=Luteococcus peritonei TaxID=88874 RepID=A0ABW4RWI0_9ACTN
MSSWLLALTVVEQLRQTGVRRVVLAPGSRNAPLSIALERASRAGEVELHVRIDERSAGFLALGMAKASGDPVAVVTTSGTAVANLAPAVMEANHAGVGLLLLTADRPVSMINSGANQTADQAGLFGNQVRAAVRLSSRTGDVAAWRFQLRHAVVAAQGVRSRQPGPVQVNLAFDEPLMPTDEQLDRPPSWQVDASLPSPPVRLPAGPRTVVLAGDAPPALGRRAHQVAEAAGVPLLAEPSSNARFGRAISSYRLLLGKQELGGEIERVVVFGHPTLSRPVTQLLRRRDVEVVVVSGRAGWADPGFSVQRVVDDVELEPVDEPQRHWFHRWLTADLDLQTRIELAERPENRFDEPPLSGHAVARAVVRATAGGQLVLGSSNPVRDADLAPTDPQLAPATVWANRGLAGIDGVVSTAAGVALATGEPTTCLLGDLTFLHDAGGLWLGTLEQAARLRLVVVDDRGGSIFHTLEQGGEAHAESFERVFGTPHAADIAGLGAAHGWQVAQVELADELRGRLAVPPRGPEVLVVRVSRTDRRAWAQRHAAL